jgi:NAD-dependent deacetylase
MVSSVADAVHALDDCRDILVFTGAGMSTESGIPDFRGPNGLWRNVAPEEYTLSKYVSSPELRARSWQRRFNPNRPAFAPNPAHTAIAALWHSRLMTGCVTQNIDGLHQAGGLPDEAVAELHGNARGIHCLDCGAKPFVAKIERRWSNGDPDPRCRACGGILKTTVVYFGEMLPAPAVTRAAEWAEQADAVVAIGSTLSVYPAADVPLTVAKRGRPYVIVNEGSTEHDSVASVRIEGRAGEVLPELVARLTAA